VAETQPTDAAICRNQLQGLAPVSGMWGLIYTGRRESHGKGKCESTFKGPRRCAGSIVQKGRGAARIKYLGNRRRFSARAVTRNVDKAWKSVASGIRSPSPNALAEDRIPGCTSR